jgi:hypothetical protein
MTDTQEDKHNNTIIKFRLETFRFLFEDLSDNQRMELIKSLIWTAPDMHLMFSKVQKELNSNKFQVTLD